MLRFLAGLVGFAGIILVLVDAFETMVLPRSVTQKFRLTRLFYQSTWRPWSALGQWLKDGQRRERFLGIFGPLSLLVLLALWALTLIVAFGLVQWGLGLRSDLPPGWAGLGEAMYFSGTTFFTLGLGDVAPKTVAARWGAVTEAGLGFGFLALVIGYLPVVYGAFSRREMLLTRLDLRAGSPPSAVELLRQHGHPDSTVDLDGWLRDCETWAAELLEAHLSYPVLCLYRSQHRDQSWLAGLVCILDTCALLVVGVEGSESRQAPMTFAMARRAILDIAHIFHFSTDEDNIDAPDRLPAEDLRRLRATLGAARAPLREGADADLRLAELRATYEPSAHALSRFVLMPLPPWLPPARPGKSDRLGDVDAGNDGASPPEDAAERLTSTHESVTDPAVV